MTTSIQASQQPHQYGSKASRPRQIWNKLIRFASTSKESALNSPTSAQTSEAESGNGDSLLLVPPNFIDYAAEGEEPADLALADMVPPGLALLNLPCASLPADLKNSLLLAQSNSTQSEIEADSAELEELIPQGLNALARAA